MPQSTEHIVFAFRGLAKELAKELSHSPCQVKALTDGVFLVSGERAQGPWLWAQFAALEGERIAFGSISEAAKILRSFRKKRCSFSVACHRRAHLIGEQAPDFVTDRFSFLQKKWRQEFLFWTLLSPQELWVSQRFSEAVPLGVKEFVENKEDPPSRAYPKLWELFTFHIEAPHEGERVLDLGAAPGGWSWVLAGLGTEVWAFDKGKLELPPQKNLHFENRDVFMLQPGAHKEAWLFCDMITEPQRLLNLVSRWLELRPETKMVCTVKFKGATDFGIIERFLALSPRGSLLHLYHNKHELTWLYNVNRRAAGSGP